MVRFIHITDTHIAAAEDFMSYGHSPLANLQRLVATLNALPYPFDFVLHTGDVTEDGSAAAYRRAKNVLSELHAPIRYLAGNHDDALVMQRELLGVDAPLERYDYAFEAGGVQFVMLDSRGPVQPGGQLSTGQLAWLSEFCTPAGPPLVIALHHEPLPLDVPWLDAAPPASPESLDASEKPAMLLGNSGEFLEAIAGARGRLRGVFFGHIHRAFQVWRDGILFSSAPSSFGQLKTWPGLREAQPAPEEAPGYCLVTVDEHHTIVQQYTFSHAG